MRGSIVDIFPMGQPLPFRIELFDDEIESLRTFDPDNQRTLDKIERVRILPAREFPLDTTAIRTFKARWFDFFEQDPKACSVYTDVAQGIAPAGVEYYLPLFFSDDLGNLFEHLRYSAPYRATCAAISGARRVIQRAKQLPSCSIAR